MIFISVGHHREKQGASYKGVTEYALATIWAEAVLIELRKRGVTSQLVFGTLKEKVMSINNGYPTVAVEIHFNSARSSEGEPIGKGSETLFYPGSMRGKRLAECIQAYLGKAYEPDRGVKEGWYQMNPMRGPDYFLAKTSCPSVIVEPEFIHRLDEIRGKYIKGCAAIASGIVKYIKEEE